MVASTRSTLRSNGQGEAEAENRSASGLVSALRTASRAEDFARIEEALAERESKLKREIEKLRHEKAVLEEKHEFERLEKLRAEDELKRKRSVTIKTEAVSEEKLPEKDEGNVVISEPPRNMQRRRSERLAAIDRGSAADNNVSEVSSASSVEGNGGHLISGYGGVAKKQMKSKNMEKNKTGKKRKGENYVQFRCNMMSFFNTMQRVKKHLTERHLELLQQAPFWPLISAFYSGVISIDQCKKSDNDVRTIIKCYNSRTMCFEFGSTSASLTTEDIAEILGLSQEGEEVQLKGTQKHISDFTKRYFEEETILYKKIVDNALEKALKGTRETDVEDVVRLIVLELCGTFLLCTTSRTIFWNLVKYCEDLEKISRYSWVKAVADVLHEALGKQTRRCKPYSVPGCVIVIMVWLCERTNLIRPINGREGHEPTLVKWRVRELHSKLNEIDVADIGLSFKKKKNKRDEMKKPLEEAKIDGQDLEEGENVLDDTAASSECEFQAQKAQKKFLSVRTISKRLNDKEDLEKRSEYLVEMIQNESAEVSKAQGKVNRLTEKLESTNAKTKNLKRKLKEEKEEKRELKEVYEFLIAEQKSLLESVKSFVKILEGTLEAEREEMKSLKKDKMEMIKEIQELKDQLNQGSPCTALQDIQIENLYELLLAFLDEEVISVEEGIEPSQQCVCIC